VKRQWFSFLLVALVVWFSTVFCAGSSGRRTTPTPAADAVQHTLAALQATATAMSVQAVVTPPPPPPADQPAAPTAPAGGQIRGQLSFPGEGIPPLRIVAFREDSQDWRAVEVHSGAEYTLDNLPAGTYYVVAYVLDGSSRSAGGYTRAVPCGLSTECSDHSLIPVLVRPGQVAEGVDPGDWYAPEDAFPPDPMGVSSSTDTGSIAGELSYPAEALPPLRVVAFRADDSNFFRYVDIHSGGSYQIDHLPPGSYYIVAYVLPNAGSFPVGLAGAYTRAVTCGLHTGCDDHSLVPVEVAAGQVVKPIYPADWLMPKGTFPPDPLGD